MLTLREHIGSPLSSFLWDPYCSSFCLFLTIHQCSLCVVSSLAPQFVMESMLLIFLVCSWLVYQCCRCLWRSPTVLCNKNSVVHVVLLLFLFTFLGPCCEDHCDCSVHLYPQLSVWLLLSYVWSLRMFAYNGAQHAFTIWVTCRMLLFPGSH
jgi:hypothetical protein